MALFRWRGDGAGVGTDFDDGRNWVDEGGVAYAQARYPGSVASTYDDVILDAAVTNGCATAAGYDAVGAADEILRSFSVAPAYDKAVGQNIANPIDIEIAHDTDPQTEDSEVIIEGDNAGDIFLCGGGTSGLLRLTVVNLQSGSILYLDEGVGTCRILKGAVTLDAGVNIATELTINYITSQTTDATVIIPSGATIPATVYSNGGQVTCYRAVTTLYLRGGTWSQGVDGSNNYGDITTLHMSGNSPKLAWLAGDIGAADVYAGILDGSEPCAFGREFTTIAVHPDGRLDLSDDLQNNTVAEGGYIQYFGGEVNFGRGQKLLPIP
jgi:hypothetical protein